ncbi:MAG: hypothetical protein RSC68_13905 [Acinetobacter sp.]
MNNNYNDQLMEIVKEQETKLDALANTVGSPARDEKAVSAPVQEETVFLKLDALGREITEIHSVVGEGSIDGSIFADLAKIESLQTDMQKQNDAIILKQNGISSFQLIGVGLLVLNLAMLITILVILQKNRKMHTEELAARKKETESFAQQVKACASDIGNVLSTAEQINRELTASKQTVQSLQQAIVALRGSSQAPFKQTTIPVPPRVPIIPPTVPEHIRLCNLVKNILENPGVFALSNPNVNNGTCYGVTKMAAGIGGNDGGGMSLVAQENGQGNPLFIKNINGIWYLYPNDAYGFRNPPYSDCFNRAGEAFLPATCTLDGNMHVHIQTIGSWPA